MANRVFKIIFVSVLILGLFAFVYYRFVVSKPEQYPKNYESQTPVYEPNIVVFSPMANEVVGSVFMVTGKARVFENQFAIRVSRGTEKLYEASVYANAPDSGYYGDFMHEVHLPIGVKAGTSLVLEALQYSPKDGSEVDKVVVPLYSR